MQQRDQAHAAELQGLQQKHEAEMAQQQQAAAPAPQPPAV
jgi:hypothetical protein